MSEREEALKLAKAAGFDMLPTGTVLEDLWVCTEEQAIRLITLAREGYAPQKEAQPEAASGEDLAVYKAISANYPRDAQPEAKAAPVALHPATADLVQRFTAALAEKLAAAERKYGYSDGWAASDWMDECRAKLVEHVAKGDPRDVAAYCAFLFHHGERTFHPAPEAGRIEDERDSLDAQVQALTSVRKEEIARMNAAETRVRQLEDLLDKCRGQLLHASEHLPPRRQRHDLIESINAAISAQREGKW